MTPEQFCYWLQGFFEISGGAPEGLSPDRVRVVVDHLALVLNKVTPERPVLHADPIRLRPVDPGRKIC